MPAHIKEVVLNTDFFQIEYFGPNSRDQRFDWIARGNECCSVFRSESIGRRECANINFTVRR